MENKLTELKIPKTKIFIVIASVLLKFYCQLSGGLSQQGELLIVNFVGAMNSIWDLKIFNWTTQVEEISKLPLSKNAISEDYIKSALKWVVIMRIIISHLYTGTYIANFYPILTFCRGKLLVPWLAMSALKNFILELIVMIVVIFLYLQGQISFYLLCEFFIHKVVTLAPAVYNWLTINSFYNKLRTMQQRKFERPHHRPNHQKSQLLCNYPNIMMGLPMLKIQPNSENLALDPETPRRFSSLTNFSRPNFESLKKYRLSKSSSLTIIKNEKIDYSIDLKEKDSPSSCECSIPEENQEEIANPESTSSKTSFFEQKTIESVSSQSNFPPRTFFLGKINNKCKLSDYTNLLNDYNDSGSSKWSSEEEIDACESCRTVINNLNVPAPKKPIAAIKFGSNKWRKKLEIIGSSFESTLQHYNHLQETRSSKSSINDLGLSRSWILDGMIITGTAKNRKKSMQKLKNCSNQGENLEIEALKAYNEKTLLKDRMQFKLSGNRGKISKNSSKHCKKKEKDKENKNFEKGGNQPNFKKIIENLDWSLTTFPSSVHKFQEHSGKFPDDDNNFSVLNIVIDNRNNTIELLQSAFGYSDRSVNGFNFGPSDIYSSSEIPNVFYEIIKTAVLRTFKHDCNYNCTADVDYCDNYWKELIELS